MDIKDIFCRTYDLDAFAKPFSTTNSEFDWFEVEEAFMVKVPVLAPTLQLRVFFFFLHNQMTQPSQRLSHFSCISFVTSCTVTCQVPLSVGFPRQEYWSGLPFSTPGHLPDPGIEPTSPVVLHWLEDSLRLSHLGSPHALESLSLIKETLRGTEHWRSN